MLGDKLHALISAILSCIVRMFIYSYIWWGEEGSVSVLCFHMFLKILSTHSLLFLLMQWFSSCNIFLTVSSKIVENATLCNVTKDIVTDAWGKTDTHIEALSKIPLFFMKAEWQCLNMKSWRMSSSLTKKDCGVVWWLLNKKDVFCRKKKPLCKDKTIVLLDR